jgi:hypothetical protein
MVADGAEWADDTVDTTFASARSNCGRVDPAAE